MLRSAERTFAVLQTVAMCVASTISVAHAHEAHSAEISPAVIAAQGDMKRAVPACSSCHGHAGEGNPSGGFPRLAGLPAPYMERQLEALADGRRTSAIMNPIAKALTPAELAALAVYYAQLPIPHVSPNAIDPMTSEAAELAQHGRPSQGLPSCVLCHGNGGASVGDDFPPLAGQSAIYIANQLRAWKQHTRPPGPMGLMSSIANKLSDSDVDDVAAYFATQKPQQEATP